MYIINFAPVPFRRSAKSQLYGPAEFFGFLVKNRLLPEQEHCIAAMPCIDLNKNKLNLYMWIYKTVSIIFSLAVDCN